MTTLPETRWVFGVGTVGGGVFSGITSGVL
jgi:hypothetical protein